MSNISIANHKSDFGKTTTIINLVLSLRNEEKCFGD